MNRLFCLLAACASLVSCPLSAKGPVSGIRQAHPPQGLAHLRAEAYIAKSKNDGPGLLKDLRGIRDLQVRCGALDSALGTGLRVVHLGGRDSDRASAAGDWTVLARAYQQIGSLPYAVDAQKRAVLILRATPRQDLRRPALLHLLDLLLLSGRQGEFKHASGEALANFRKANDRKGENRVLLLQGESLSPLRLLAVLN